MLSKYLVFCYDSNLLFAIPYKTSCRCYNFFFKKQYCLSVCKQTDLVLRTLKRKNRWIYRKRFLAIAHGNSDNHHCLFQKLPKEMLFPPYVPLTQSKAIKVRSSKRDQHQSSLWSTF